ncbi:MAG TPA: condensation domain-containing protein, partial [Thermoanaerobaculia bacterium]|nr:condensation domain-containing protein [Thermoanaerobaculia bacterium]
EDAAPSTSELRAHLARTLPAELVPSAFVLLDALPLAPTGKVDRGALPPPGRERPDLAAAYAAPRTALERRLARIFGDLLGLDRVGVDDDLFELGGHSLVVTRLASRVRSELDRELALSEVFARPTVRALASRLEAAPQAPGDVRRPPPIERAPRDRDLPLSFPQERIWFLHQLAPETVAYGFQFTVRFRGVLAPAALERALTEIVRRHEVLRTTFPARAGRPVQAIHPPFRVALPVVDLGALPAARREAVARALVARAIRRPFDLERLPLFRPALVRLGPGDHLFLQVEHHFVHDGWSLALYLRELLALYRAYAAGRPSSLPEPPIQYADFAAWQRRWMAGETLERELAFWRARLPRDLPPLELPADRRRPRVHGFRGGALRVDMAPALYAAARAFARARGVTLFMTLLAAFEALLARTTGRREFLLGSGVANRRLRETEELIGMVVNTVVLPCRVDGRAPFLDLLERVRRTTLEVHEHQDLPFERLVEELQPERDLSRNPLFQVLFSFHDAAVPDLELPGLAGELFEWHNGTAKADLNVVVKPMVEQRVGRARAGDEALTMVWEYSSDLFEPATAERLWSHYRTLLAAALESPERTVEELPLLTGAEAEQLRVWGRGGGEPPAASVPELVAARAVERPAAPAVVAAGRILSYGGLTARAALLAGELRSLGIGPGSLVAVLAGRSAETAVAALAAWRAGAAYLPLDPAHPEERLRFLLEDAGAAALVAAREPGAGLAERLG